MSLTFYLGQIAGSGGGSGGGTNFPCGNFNATESAEETFTSFVLGTPYAWSSGHPNSAKLIADFQGWLIGTTPKNGWLMKSDLETSPTSFLGFWSREGAAADTTAGSDPAALTITYSVP